MSAAAPPLPRLRDELALLDGPRLPDGQPSWTLHDPVRNRFFQLDWPSIEILSRWSLAEPARIAERIRAETTLEVEADDVEVLLRFLAANELLAVGPGQAARLAGEVVRRKGSLATWLLHNYLFLRLPLVRPDAWLARWAPRLGFLFGRGFLAATVLAGLLGLAGIMRGWEQYSATLVDMLTWQGLAAYGVAIAIVKVLHELGHGFTAKRFGCRVPTMGVAFLVLWPVAYTDTNEVWKLTRRDQRLAVAAAGIATELAVAAWASLAWSLLPEGGPKGIAFLLSSTTWIATLAVNASPFMRFDGYFLAADWLQMPNLHGRAFALARWDLRERLFALGEPAPEHFGAARRRGLILFAWGTWLYRLVLFLGIAALVYHFFIKAVGIMLFAVEIGWFVAMPLMSELKAWHERRDAILARPRARRTLLLAVLGSAFFVLPWPTPVTGSGLLQPQDSFVIVTPEQAQLAALPFRNGEQVPAGAVVVEFASPQLAARAGQSNARRERLASQAAAAGFDPELRRDWQVLREQQATAEAEDGTIAADAGRYAPRTPHAGVLRDVDPELRVGDWLAHREPFGRVVGSGPRQVVTYVDEEDVTRIAPGDAGLFVADGLSGPVARLEVERIDADASHTLSEPELAASFGGHVLVRERQGLLYPERAVYRVQLKVLDSELPAQHAWRGRVSIAGRWEAPGLRFLRSATNVLWRESGF